MTGFSPSLGKLDNLRYAHVLYAYDHRDGTTLIIEHNNTIYLGGDMEDSLCDPIQSEEAGTKVDIRSRHYYEDSDGLQNINFPDGTIIPILPYIPVRRPRTIEIDSYRRIRLTLRDHWDPFHFNSRLSTLTGEPNSTNSVTYTDPISLELMSCRSREKPSSHQLLHGVEQKDHTIDSLPFRTLGAFNSQQTDSLTPESLSMMWQIRLKTAKNTIDATTHKCIRSTGLPSKRFKTDKSQLKYNQLSRHYGTFYVDFLKIAVKSIRGFIGGMLYCNKLGYKKFFPCTSETQEETSHSLRSFIEIVGLPASLHSDNHNNLREGLFKKTLSKFGI